MTVSEDELQAFVGQEAEPPRVARYAVDEAMIRNWVEAHEDLNPVYVDEAAAVATGRAGVVCPPAMLSTWVMSGYRRYREVRRLRAAGKVEDFAYSRLMSALDAAGYTSVVATAVEQTYLREVHPGEQITTYFTIESLSPVKRTGLGEGRFVTLLKHYRVEDEVVAEERFVMLRFKP